MRKEADIGLRASKKKKRIKFKNEMLALSEEKEERKKEEKGRGDRESVERKGELKN